MKLDVVIVDDCSNDDSGQIAARLCERFSSIQFVRHNRNQGKGAALRTGFQNARGDFVGIHDADLEYDPRDLVKLLQPLLDGDADVVYGSRFLSGSARRVLYFWHSMGNALITLLSNMFTDMNLTDMETCYKVFRREVLENVDIKEDRFGFEPEITAKIAAQRVRVYEIGISYYGRTYEEGKKIGIRDGFRALYCIFRYTGHHAPVGLQFLVYTLIGGSCAIFNLLSFLGLRTMGVGIDTAVVIAFVLAALLNYFLCILILFRAKAHWSTTGEQIAYWLVVAGVGVLDLIVTRGFLWAGLGEASAKAISSALGLFFNFAGRRWIVFPEPGLGPWKRQND